MILQRKDIENGLQQKDVDLNSLPVPLQFTTSETYTLTQKISREDFLKTYIDKISVAVKTFKDSIQDANLYLNANYQDVLKMEKQFNPGVSFYPSTNIDHELPKVLKDGTRQLKCLIGSCLTKTLNSEGIF